MHLRAVCEPPTWFFAQALSQHRNDWLGNRLASLPPRQRLLRGVPTRQILDALSDDRQIAGQQIEEHHAHRVEVTRLFSWFSAKEFRRHVMGSAAEIAGRRTVFTCVDPFGKPKIGQLEGPGFGDEDIGGFHVSVKNLVVMDEVEAIEELLHDSLDLAETELDVGVTQKTSEVMLTELKHQEERTLVAVVLCG